jgi:hypothetical protein
MVSMETIIVSKETICQAGSRLTASAQAFYDARVSEVYASVDEPSWDDPSKALARSYLAAATSRTGRGV